MRYACSDFLFTVGGYVDLSPAQSIAWCVSTGCHHEMLLGVDVDVVSMTRTEPLEIVGLPKPTTVVDEFNNEAHVTVRCGDRNYRY